jgi:DNA-binding PadR family transcriptional regulator
MPLKDAVLALLQERRGYGHELLSRLEDRLGPGVEVPAGTFYSALGKLVQEGFVTIGDRKVVRNRERVYYETTGAGSEHVNVWLDEPLVHEPLRGEVFLKLAVVDASRVSTLRERFEELERDVLSEMVRVTSAPSLADEAVDPLPPELVMRWLIESRARDYLTGELAFIRRALTVLDWIEANGSVPRRKLLEAVSSV